MTYKGIDLLVALRIVLLDVLKLSRIMERRNVPVQLTHPAVDGRVAGADVSQVGLEMLDGGIEADVAFRNVLAPVVRPLRRRQVLLNAVERLEECCHCRFVGILRSASDLSIIPLRRADHRVTYVAKPDL